MRTAATIRGQVVAPGRANSGGIEVTLEKDPSRQVTRTDTDSVGNFEFSNLEGGRYEVVVRLDGYLDARQGVELENVIEMLAPTDGDPPQPSIGDTGGLNQSTVYMMLTPVNGNAVLDPEMVALNRKYPRKVIQEYERSQDDVRKGNVVKSAERLEALLKDVPDFYRAQMDLGALYQKQNRYRDAERRYKLARELTPLSALPLVSLGSLYLQEADSALEETPDAVGRILDNALDILEEAVKLEPHAAPAYYLLGAAYYRSGFFEEAEDNLKRALEIEQTLGAARLTLINVYLRQENWPSALEHLDLFTIQNPNSPNRPQLIEIRTKVVESIERNLR